MKHEQCQQYVGRMYVKVGHDVQAQTILKVKFLVFIGSSFYQCNDIFDTSRIWLLVSGKDQKNVTLVLEVTPSDMLSLDRRDSLSDLQPRLWVCPKRGAQAYHYLQHHHQDRG